jgi:hypothetical protein
VKLPVEALFPEIQKFLELWITGNKIEFLPDKSLEEPGVIGHVVEDLSGRQTIVAKLQRESRHGSLLPPSSFYTIAKVSSLRPRVVHRGEEAALFRSSPGADGNFFPCNVRNLFSFSLHVRKAIMVSR